MALELDPGAGAISPQELDAEPYSSRPRRRATSRAGCLSVPAEWPVNVEVLAGREQGSHEAVDELVKLYVSKSGSFKTADGKSIVKSLSELDEFVEQGSQD